MANRFNWRNALGTGAAGAGSGAALGAMAGNAIPIPGVGAGIGAGIGAAAGGLSGFFGGASDTPEEFKQIPLYSPQQQQYMEQLLGQGMQNYDPQAIGDAARYQFKSRTVPQMANQFAGLGDNQISSAGFGQAVGSRAADLESQLAALNSQMAMQQMQMGMQPMFDTMFRPERPSQLSQFTRDLLPIAGSLGGQYLRGKYFGNQPAGGVR